MSWVMLTNFRLFEIVKHKIHFGMNGGSIAPGICPVLYLYVFRYSLQAIYYLDHAVTGLGLHLPIPHNVLPSAFQARPIRGLVVLFLSVGNSHFVPTVDNLT